MPGRQGDGGQRGLALAAYGAAEEGGTTRGKDITEMIAQDLENQ